MSTDFTLYLFWLVLFIVIALGSAKMLTAEFVDWCEESEWVHKLKQNWDSTRTAQTLQIAVCGMIMSWLAGVFADFQVTDAEMGGVFSAVAAFAIILINFPYSRKSLYGEDTPVHITQIKNALINADEEMKHTLDVMPYINALDWSDFFQNIEQRSKLRGF